MQASGRNCRIGPRILLIQNPATAFLKVGLMEILKDK
jgi:hypothetical protein